MKQGFTEELTVYGKITEGFPEGFTEGLTVESLKLGYRSPVTDTQPKNICLGKV